MTEPITTCAAELQDLIHRVFVEQMGGRASASEIRQRLQLPDHLDEWLRNKGLAHAIGTYFRQRRDDGLPQAPEVNAEGEHAQLELLTVEEYGYLVGRYLMASTRNRAKADAAARRCFAVYGRYPTTQATGTAASA